MHYGQQRGHELGREVRVDRSSLSNVEFISVYKTYVLSMANR